MGEVFAAQFAEAEPVAPQPLDLSGDIGEAGIFPVSALSPTLQGAIMACEAFAQVPLSLAAQSVLGAASLAAQGFINVETITEKVVPASVFLLTVAASGDRKSTSDGLAIAPIKDREEQLGLTYEQRKHEYAIDDAAFKAATRKATSGNNKSRSEIRSDLETVGRPPVPPVQPVLTVDEPTGAGLQRLFAEAMPALGLFSDEGATFLGGYSMQEEHQAATGAMLSKLWDGQPIKRIRADKENGTTILRGRRLCVHLMVQPNVAGKLLGNKAVRDQGLLSRMLVVAPKSIRGTRFWKEREQENRDALARYHVRLGRLLATDYRFRDEQTREIDFAIVRLTPEARAKLIQFSDHCERRIGPGGPYESIADFAAKMTENATRLAAIIGYFEGGAKVVTDGLSERAASAGIALMEFYASEALRLYGTAALDDDTTNAASLIDFIRKRDLTAVGHRFLNRNGPKETRNAPALKRAIDILVEYNHLVPIAGGATLDHDGKPKFYAKAYTVIPTDVD